LTQRRSGCRARRDPGNGWRFGALTRRLAHYASTDKPLGGDREYKGSFNEPAQTIIMTATVGGVNIGTFTGCLMRTPLRPRPGQDVVATLVGQVQVSHFTDLGANHPIGWTPRRNVYGWMATINEVV
jgi:hypothetical protein